MRSHRPNSCMGQQHPHGESGSNRASSTGELLGITIYLSDARRISIPSPNFVVIASSNPTAVLNSEHSMLRKQIDMQQTGPAINARNRKPPGGQMVIHAAEKDKNNKRPRSMIQFPSRLAKMHSTTILPSLPSLAFPRRTSI